MVGAHKRSPGWRSLRHTPNSNQSGSFPGRGKDSAFPSCQHCYSSYLRSVWVFIAYGRMDGSLDGWVDGCMGGKMDGWMLLLSHSDLSALEAWTAQPGQDLVPSASSDTQCPPPALPRGWGLGTGASSPSPGCAHTLLACSSIMPFPASRSCHSTSC